MKCQSCSAALSGPICEYCGTISENFVDKDMAQKLNIPQKPLAQPSPPASPKRQLKTDRNTAMIILLSFLTFGIYLIAFWYSNGKDMNEIASRHDGKKTMNFVVVSLLLAPITCGIVALVWFHNISARIGAELRRRGINYSFDAVAFWLWGILGSFVLVGPFIYMHKVAVAMNLLAADYNVKD